MLTLFISKHISKKTLAGIFIFSLIVIQGGLFMPTNTLAVDDTTPPSTPSLVSPADNSTINTSTSTSKFDWTDATDDTAVTSYEIQIAGDSAFTVNPFTLTPTASERQIDINSFPTDYFWHVRAVDAASNMGDWSATWKLTVDNTVVTPEPEATSTDPVATSTDPVATTTDPVATTTPAVEDISVCSIQPAQGRLIFNFPTSVKKLVSDPSFGNTSTVGPATDVYPFAISAGTYAVTLSSYDSYNGRASVSQPKEQYLLDFYKGNTLIGTSNAIGDLTDFATSTSRTEVVNVNLGLMMNVTMIQAKHAFYPDASSPNSVIPLCAGFDLVTASTTPPDGGNGTTTATTTDTTGTTTDETGGGVGGGDDDNPPVGGGTGGSGPTNTPSSRSGSSHRSGGSSGGSVLGASDVSGLGGADGEVLGAAITAPNAGFGPESTSTSLTLIAGILFLSALGFGFYNRKALFATEVSPLA